MKIGSNVPGPASAAANVPASDLAILSIVNQTSYGTLGSPQAPRLWMLVDPMCSFSVRAVEALLPAVKAGKVQLAIIPLSVLDYEDQA